jgi:23S rRNA (pseudouridine1915-N3)-methyltransferase
VNIYIVAVAKIKENYIKSGIENFKKRLGRYADVNVIEVKSARVPKNPSGAQIEQVKIEEGERILSSMPSGTYQIALDVKGKPMTSKGLSKSIQNLQVKGYSDISFIIGGPHGLGDQVIDKADYSLSLSHMTFTHQMIRLILLEQVYRAFKIIKGEPYHL